jgi:hypothetical protein
LEVCSSVADGSLPKPSAIVLLLASFPTLTPEKAGAIVNPIEVKEPEPPPVPPAAPPPHPPGRAAAPPPPEKPGPAAEGAQRSAVFARMARVLEAIEDRMEGE